MFVTRKHVIQGTADNVVPSGWSLNSYQREGQPRKTENEFNQNRFAMIHWESIGRSRIRVRARVRDVSGATWLSKECWFIRTMDWLCFWSMFQDETFQWSRKSQVFYIAVTKIFVNIVVLFTRSAYRFFKYIEDSHLGFPEIVRFSVNHREAIVAKLVLSLTRLSFPLAGREFTSSVKWCAQSVVLPISARPDPTPQWRLRYRD